MSWFQIIDLLQLSKNIILILITQIQIHMLKLWSKLTTRRVDFNLFSQIYSDI